jgi:predicted ArsR family transcriptional regulator
MPETMVNSLFTQMAQDMAMEYQAEARNLSLEQRLDLVTNMLSDEGFTVEWEKQGEQYLIREISCPYYRIGQNHPEVCAVDQTLISTVLSVPAEKVNCVLNGDACCTYLIAHQPLAE